MANATNTVPFWGVYGSGQSFDYDPASTGPGRQFLEALRKIDPNASFVRGQSGGGEGGPGQENWTLQTTASFPGVDLNSGDYGPQYWQPRDGSYSQQQYGHDFNTDALVNPNLTHSDPVFGTYTDQSNTRQTSSPLDYLGPAAVGAFGLLMGGVPALYQGVFGQGAYGAGGASGLGASDPFLNGGTGAMDMTGSAGTGIPGSFGANAPLGSAESSLYGTGVQTAPETAFGGTPFDLSQTAAPIVDHSIPATVGDSLRNGAMPSLGSVARSAGSLLSPALRAASGLLGSKPSGGGGGIGLLGGGGAGPGGEDAASIIARYYGEDPLTKLRNRMRNG